VDSFINVVGVILGIGFLIFIHELGHFAVAKWYNVKVEKFSIGFGPPIFQFQKGETAYVLGWIPLGGYVAMLNEEGPPAGSPTRFGTQGSARPETQTEAESVANDPRSFPNQTVNARMAIMVAGVLMNILFGLACFAVLYGSGALMTAPAIVGDVLPNTPAYTAGLRSGDEIVAVNAITSDLDFDRMRMVVALSGAGETVKLHVKRPGQDDPLIMNLEPRRVRPGDMTPMIGITSISDLELAEVRLQGKPVPPFLAPAGLIGPATIIQRDPSLAQRDQPFVAGDRIVEVGVPGGPRRVVGTMPEFERILTEFRDRPLELVLEARQADSSDSAKPAPRLTVLLPPNRVVDPGLRLTAGPVTAVRGGGPADLAGIQPGDRIIAVSTTPSNPETADAALSRDFDPLRLSDRMMTAAVQGIPVRLELQRGEQRLEVTARPDLAWSGFRRALAGQRDIDVAALGLSMIIEPIVASVQPNSPADRAGIKPGDVLSGATLRDTSASEGDSKAAPQPIDFTFWESDDQLGPDGFGGFFDMLQTLPEAPFELRVRGRDQPLELTAQPVADWFTVERGLLFNPLTRRLPAMSPVSAIRRGLEETWQSILNIYATILRMIQGRVSTKALSGPIGIFDVGTRFISQGWVEFLRFLGILSINLAVVNLLPITPLDGGRLLLLLGEKARGRPLPPVLVGLTERVGITLVLLLMVFAIGQDLLRTFWSG